MRLKIIAICWLLTGCATYSYDSPSSLVGVESLPKSCWRYDRSVPINLVVRNTSHTTVRFLIRKESSNSPYELSWLSYDVLKDDNRLAVDQGPGDHGPLPQNTLEISTGDSARVVADFYDFRRIEPSMRFRIQLKDLENNVYLSPVFTPCR